MKIASWRVVSLLTSIALSLGLANAANAAKQIDVLEMDFVHFSLGHVCVVTNKDYFKIVCSDNHFECVAKSPEWRVFSYNRNNRLFNVTNADQYRTFLAQMNEGWFLKFPPDTLIKKREYCGLPAITRDVFIKGRKLGWNDSYVGDQMVSEEVANYEGDMVSKTCAKVVNEMLDMHSLDGMYLALKYVDKKGKTDTRFDCKKSFRKTVSTEFFDVPPGFHKGTIAQVVGNAPADMSGVKTLIDDMGIGKSF